MKQIFKASSHVFRLGVIAMMALIFFGSKPAKLPPVLEKKLHSALEAVYPDKKYELDIIKVSPDINESVRLELGGDNLFSIKDNEAGLIGYAYIGQAPSMKNIFDYLVILEPELRIKKAKVLIYREDYGRQIGSQRWLKQFIGRESGENLTYGEDVDAISGATISAKSMCSAVNDVMAAMAVLKSKNIL